MATNRAANRVLLALAGLLAALTGATVPSTAGVNPRYGGVVEVVVANALAPVPDPRHVQAPWSRLLAAQLTVPLFEVGEDGRTRSNLLTSWETSDGGQTWRLTLRSGLKFSDGSPLRAQELVAAWRQLCDSEFDSPYRWLFQEVRGFQRSGRGADVYGLRAISDRTVQIETRTPVPDLPKMLSHPAASAFRPTAGRSEYVSVGPFRVKSEGARGSLPVLEANPFCPAGPPLLQRLELRRTGSLSDARAGFDTMFPILRPGDLSTAHPNHNRVEFADAEVVFVTFNHNADLFQYQYNRESFLSLLNPSRLLSSVFKGQGRMTKSFVAPLSAALDAAPPGQTKFVAPTDTRLRIIVPRDDSDLRALASVIATSMKRRDVLLDVRPLDRASFMADIRTGAFDIALDVVFLEFDDDLFQLKHLIENHIPVAQDLKLYLDSYLYSASKSERHRAAARVNELLIEELISVPLFTLHHNLMVGKKIQGISPRRAGYLDMGSAWLSP